MRGYLCELGCLVILLAISGAVSPAWGVEIGQPSPALVIRQLDGKSFDLNAQRGKVVVVSFWATWCPPCRAEMPVLDAVYRRYRDQGLAMVGLSADRPHDRDAALKMAQTAGYPEAILNDAGTNDFGRPGGLPLTLVIDRGGTVRFKFSGDEPVTEAKLFAAVAQLLAEHPEDKSRKEDKP